MIEKKSLSDIDVEGENVFVRSDLNVPLNESNEVEGEFRIRKSAPTIDRVANQDGIAVVGTHLGRPGGKRVDELSVSSVGRSLQKHLGREVNVLDDVVGEQVEQAVQSADPGDVILLENLRFHPGETENEDGFAQQLASLADVYINDAFGASHRRHASITGIIEYLDNAAAGLLLQDELRHLSRLQESPEEPFVLLLGGSKVQDKVSLVQALEHSVDRVLVAGALAFPFLRAKGHQVGEYELDEGIISAAEDILSTFDDSDTDLELPVDQLITDTGPGESGTLRITDRDTDSGWRAGDIGPRTIKAYRKYLAEAETVFWNGPLGEFEVPHFQSGTELLGRYLADQPQKTRVAGGGNTAEALVDLDISEDLDHVSTGGGALLEYFETGSLPGVDVLPDR